MTSKQTRQIKAFVSDMIAIGEWHYHIAVRGMQLAKSLKVAAIASNTHDHLAIVFDDLGNAFVLTVTGQRLQLIGGEIAS